MVGRTRLPIGTFGDVKTNQVGPGRFRAYARFRDWDGETRQVLATAASRGAAKSALKVQLATRMRLGDGDTLTADSPFTKLADAWIEDVRRDVDRSDARRRPTLANSGRSSFRTSSTSPCERSRSAASIGFSRISETSPSHERSIPAPSSA